MHVAIAVLGGTTGGPATYGMRLVAALAARGDLRLSVLTDVPAAFAATAGVEAVALPMRGGLDRLRWQYVALPRALRRLAPDVFHDTKNALPRGLRMPAVVTVHDLAYHTVPESFGFASRAFLRWATRDAVRRAAAIVVPSQATATDLQRFHPRAADRLHVVPHGTTPARRFSAPALAAERIRLRLPEPFVLHVGTIQARKHVDLVVDGVRGARARGLPHRCVLVGRRGWLADRALAAIAADPDCVWIRHANDTDLAAIYALADAFVSPSAYEGFGFAVADALAAGVPTIVSDVSSLPELCGDAALRLPELSAAAVTTTLLRLLGDERLRRELATRGPARAAQFSWTAAAAGHAAAYAAARARR